MTDKRLSGSDRLQQLLLAIRKVESGRSKQIGPQKLSIAAVAREANVSPALIHNSYPTVAALIREKQSTNGQSRASARLEKLELYKLRIRELREEVLETRRKLSQIASINEVLVIENARLIACLDNPDVVVLPTPRRR
ncbi:MULTISPECIES: hypothetical protein [Novilysobacter]|uniref:hypothetical protein n=1 Tax=Novilysobacter TaxID=3382699 RepID=UPI002ED97C8A